MLGGEAYLGLVLDLARQGRALDQRGVDLGHHHVDAGEVRLGQRLEAGLEGPDLGRLSAGVLQAPRDRNAHDRLTADRAVVIGLPDRGRALGGEVGVAELRQVAGAVRARLGGHQRGLHVLRRRAPERERSVGQQPVQLGGDVEAVVDVSGLVHHPFAKLVPGRAPGVALQLHGRREPAREAHGEIESHQSPLRALLQVGQDGVEPRLGRRPGRLVVALERQPEAHVTLQHADPDGVGPRGRLGGGAPVDDHIGAEQARHGRLRNTNKGAGDAGVLAPAL